MHLLVFDTLAILSAVIVGYAVPGLGATLERHLRRPFRWIASRKALSVVLVGVVAFAGAAAMSLCVQMPIPAVHDEFCYLLGADTFVHGRLTNPIHPMWEHFESYHLFHQPTYQMKYPAGQSVALAAGQLLGNPIIGVWISFALACGAVCWMLQGWVPARWALLGSVMMMLNFNLVRYWSQVYWGGAVAMAGGALVFGALPRLIRGPRVSTSLLLATGVAMLANSRPYEGLLATLAAGAILLGWLIGKRRPAWGTFVLRVVLPGTAVLVPVAAWMLYYNYRVTGDPLTMPYQVYQQTYGGSLLSTIIRHDSAGTRQPAPRRIPIPRASHNATGVRPAARGIQDRYLIKLVLQWAFFVNVILTVPLCSVRFGKPKILFAVLTVLIVLIAVVSQSTSGNLHYTAPVAALIYLLVVDGMRDLAHCQWKGRAVGRFLVRALPVVAVASFVVAFWSWTLNPVQAGWEWSVDRARIEAELANNGRRHLVIVRYGPGHNFHHEWVYNGAEIDEQPVVWARELSPEQNRELLKYFSDRVPWLLLADAPHVQLVPYPPEARDGPEPISDATIARP